MPQLNRYAPPSPARWMASQSAVIPSRVTFPSSQCHQVSGLASAGGRENRSASSSAAEGEAVSKVAHAAQNAAANQRTVCLFNMLVSPEGPGQRCHDT